MYTRLTLVELPRAIKGPVLVDDLGRPRLWAAAWSILALGDAAETTREKRLRYLENLYAHSDSTFGLGSLDSSLGSLDMDQLSRILETWFISIANQPRQNSSDEARWQTGYGFVKFIVSWRLPSATSSARLKALQGSLDRLAHLYRQLRIQKPRQANQLRSLTKRSEAGPTGGSKPADRTRFVGRLRPQLDGGFEKHFRMWRESEESKSGLAGGGSGEIT